MSAKKKVPAIRFQGFCGEWEEKALGKNANFSKGHGYSKNDLIDSGEPIILYGRLYTKYETVISKVDTFVKANTKSIISKGNEVVVPASGETAEDISRASAVSEHGFLLGGDLNIIYPNDKIDSIFLALTLSNGNPQKELSAKAQGKSVVHIRNTDLKEIDILYPAKKEQTKIGNFFQKLDSLISQQQKKYEKLQNLKKALLQKMFPQQGQSVPELRFQGFCGEWEERSFENIFIYERPDNYIVKSTEYSGDYKTPVLTANKGFILGYTSESEVFNRPSIIFDDFTLDSKFVNFPYMVKSSAIKILLIKNEAKDDLYFSYNLLNTIKIEVMGHARHYISVVQRTVVRCPAKKEQTQIGNFFQELDKLLSQQQAQLEKLKNIKKACLEKMFV